MLDKIRGMLCFLTVSLCLTGVSYAKEYKGLTSKEVGNYVLFSCDSNDNCGIDEKNTMKNYKQACVKKNNEANKSYVKKCAVTAFKEMKTLYSFYY